MIERIQISVWIDSGKDFVINNLLKSFDYLHFNPVIHGLVKNVADLPRPYSSFHHWLKQGVYPMHWGSKIEDRACLDLVRDAYE